MDGSPEFGFSMSVRGLLRLGSSLSVLGVCRLGSSLSVFDAGRLGSSISLRGVSRVGSSLSLFGCSHLGSSLSLRQFARLGSSFSVFGGANFGARLSIFGVSDLGSSLSMRSGARLGGTLSVCDAASFNNVNAVSVFAHGISVQDILHLTRESTYITTGNAMQEDELGNPELWHMINFYTAPIFTPSTSFRSISMYGKGGRLHGQWTADTFNADTLSSSNFITSSDRRLKKSIKSLYEEFQAPSEQKDVYDGVSWVLRQLRPVSYKFKTGPEAKYSRYGFIAQELKEVLPAVVRDTVRDGKPRLGVAYQDLIALLTSAAQMLQEKVNVQERKIARLEELVSSLDKKLDMLVDAQADKATKKEPTLVL